MTLAKEFKKLYKSPDLLISNMKNVYNQCNEDELTYGKDWYKHANLFSLALAETYSLNEMKVAGIISALSPQKEWVVNKSIADKFISSKGKISKHTSVQTSKALRILNDLSTKSDIEECLGGLKTINFFNNIQNPYSENHVTIDRHHLFITTGRDVKYCTPKQYEFIKKNTIIFANELDVIPSNLQSMLWMCWKRIKKDGKIKNSKKE